MTTGKKSTTETVSLRTHANFVARSFKNHQMENRWARTSAMWRKVRRMNLPDELDRRLQIAVLYNDYGYIEASGRWEHGELAARALQKAGWDQEMCEAVATSAGRHLIAQAGGAPNDYYTLTKNTELSLLLGYVDATVDNNGENISLAERAAAIGFRYGANSFEKQVADYVTSELYDIEKASQETAVGNTTDGVEALGDVLYVFDAGGVLFSDGWLEDAINGLGAEGGVENPWEIWKTELRESCWKGHWTRRGFNAAVARHLHVDEARVAEVMNNLKPVMLPQTPDVLEQYWNSGPFYLLSNHRSLWLNQALDENELWGYFERVFVSDATGHMKPEKPAYQDVDDMWQNRGPVVYLDDQKRNLEAAPETWIQLHIDNQAEVLVDEHASEELALQ